MSAGLVFRTKKKLPAVAPGAFGLQVDSLLAAAISRKIGQFLVKIEAGSEILC